MKEQIRFENIGEINSSGSNWTITEIGNKPIEVIGDILFARCYTRETINNWFWGRQTKRDLIKKYNISNVKMRREGMNNDMIFYTGEIEISPTFYKAYEEVYGKEL